MQIVPESLRASGTARVELSSHELKLFPRALIRAREQLVRADSPAGRTSTRAVGHTKTMNEKPYHVYVVVDPHYGERPRNLPADDPIWVIDSETNHIVIQALWNERQGSSYLHGITSFKYDPKGNPEDWFMNELDTID